MSLGALHGVTATVPAPGDLERLAVAGVTAGEDGFHFDPK